ncbi:MAG TPA: HlyD family efflux transporter periplasmic adaptor subunit [Kofleriaceae bacterium]|nr:HlyD family efflux transporter periplasmic adaptor subunit [Kofleriaceae bacterium]
MTDVDPTKPTAPDVCVAPLPADYIAIVKAKRSEVLAAAFTGRVLDIRVRPSQTVHAGEVLARQDTAELRNQLEQSEAEEASARAIAFRSSGHVNAAEHKLRLQRRLAMVGASAQIAVDDATTEVAEANATALADRKTADARAATVASVKGKIEHADITAPFDGVISIVHVKDGDSVMAGAAILRILDPSELVVSFAVPSEDDTSLLRDMKVQLQLPHRAPIGAVITEIADDIEPPFSYRIVDAEIDARTVGPGDIKLSSVGRVTLAAH